VERIAARGVRGEELDHQPVVEREPARAEPLSVRGEIGAPAGDPGLEVRQAVAPVTEGAEDVVERREEIDDRSGVAAQRLLQEEVRRLAPELASLNELVRVSV